MKKSLLLLMLLYFFIAGCFAQQLVIKGTLRCMNTTASSTKGAVNIIIIPSFNPAAAVSTTTTPQGFFQINTGWDAKKLQDKNVSLYIITRCSNCKRIQRVFISEDLDKRNTDPTKMYVTVKGWKLLENCKSTELEDLMSSRLLDSAHQLPAETVDAKAPGSPALAPVSFLNLFEKLLSVAVTGNSGLFKVKNIPKGNIRYGNFLHSSAMINTDNTGFNFSPNRNLSEAVFWNAAAIANTVKPGNVSLLANFKNNIKLSGYQRVTNKLFVGIGGIYTKQDEVRKIQFESTNNPGNTSTQDHREKLKEFAVFLAPVYKINNKLSVGVTAKSIWQQFNNPLFLAVQQDNTTSTFYNFFNDDTIKKQHFDFDVSVNYKITSFLQAGISVMNATGTKLYADMFIKDSANQQYINQRAYGIGICYKRERFNAGVDVLLTDKDLYDVSAGINYVPFNDALIAAGYAFRQKSFSASFKLKHFKIAYINDNNLVVNNTTKASSKAFNGKIYSGFVFNF